MHLLALWTFSWVSAIDFGVRGYGMRAAGCSLNSYEHFLMICASFLFTLVHIRATLPTQKQVNPV